jgi:penicillin-binding protein 1C
VERVATSSPAVAAASAGRRSTGLILRRACGATLLAVLLLYVATVAMRAHFTSPLPTPIVYDRHGVFLAQFGDVAPGGGGPRVTYGYWPVDRLPQHVVAATLALEDRRFWSHPGVDPVAVLRATWQDIEGLRRRSGASTIAMQVARMQHPEARAIWTKAVEAGTALALTVRYGRDAVLAQYLRLVHLAGIDDSVRLGGPSRICHSPAEI